MKSFPGRSINIRTLSLCLENNKESLYSILKRPACFSWAGIQVNVSKWVRGFKSEPVLCPLSLMIHRDFTLRIGPEPCKKQSDDSHEKGFKSQQELRPTSHRAEEQMFPFLGSLAFISIGLLWSTVGLCIGQSATLHLMQLNSTMVPWLSNTA